MARKSNDGTDSGGFQWKSFISYTSSFLLLVILVGALVGVTIGMRPLEVRAASLVSAPQERVRVIFPPLSGAKANTGETWLPRDDQEAVVKLANDAIGADSPFTRAALERVGQALFSSGWFEEPPRVMRERGGSITVRGVWRIPAAVVRYNDKDYLISWDARILPKVFAKGEAARLPAIIDPAVSPPKRNDTYAFGEPWPGEDIAASLELIRTASEYPWYGQVSGIEAGEFATSGTLTILTRMNTRVVWGGRPSKPALGEVSTKQKLAHLAQLYADSKRIDATYPRIYINSSKVLFDISASAAEAASPTETSPAADGSVSRPASGAAPGTGVARRP